MGLEFKDIFTVTHKISIRYTCMVGFFFFFLTNNIYGGFGSSIYLSFVSVFFFLIICHSLKLNINTSNFNLLKLTKFLVLKKYKKVNYRGANATNFFFFIFTNIVYLNLFSITKKDKKMILIHIG